MNLKNQLQAIIAKRGLTITQLARMSGVSKQTLSDWLSGSQPRRVTQIKQVADALGCSLDHLCYGNGIDLDQDRVTELDALLGDEWVSGLFEIRFRRVKKPK